jgi:hypothetical protein
MRHYRTTVAKKKEPLEFGAVIQAAGRLRL